MNRWLPAIGAALLCLAPSAFGVEEAREATQTQQPVPESPEVEEEFRVPEPIRLWVPGINRVWRLNDNYLTGDGPPPTAEGFRALAAMGVRTIISVDFAAPDAPNAAAAGMSTVHVPVRPGELAGGDFAAFLRPLWFVDSPFYIHAGPGEDRAFPLAVMAVSLADRSGHRGAELRLTALQYDQTAGTLWREALTPERYWFSGEQIQAPPADFPREQPSPTLQVWMQWLDRHFEALREFESLGWRPLPLAPHDLPVERAEALAAYIESLSQSHGPPAGDSAAWSQTGAAARELAETLREDAHERASAALGALAVSCLDCHRAHRDQQD